METRQRRDGFAARTKSLAVPFFLVPAAEDLSIFLKSMCWMAVLTSCVYERGSLILKGCNCQEACMCNEWTLHMQTLKRLEMFRSIRYSIFYRRNGDDCSRVRISTKIETRGDMMGKSISK